MSKQTPEHIRKRVEARKKNGTYHFSEESRKNMGAGAKRRIKNNPDIAQERVSAMRLAWKGKHHTENTKKRLSEKKVGSQNPMWGKPMSLEHRKKIGNANRGKPKFSIRGSNHPNWKGGVRTEHEIIRGSLEYIIWRRAVFERDNYTCIWCGAKSGEGKTVVLNADHIKPFLDYPELRFAIDNGRTLCVPCHKTTNNYGFRRNIK